MEKEQWVVYFPECGKYNKAEGWEVSLEEATVYPSQEEAAKAADNLYGPPCEVIRRPNPGEKDLTTEEVYLLLELKSQETVKNWLQGGYFPGAYVDETGTWRFPLQSVREMRAYFLKLRDLNARKYFELSDVESDEEPPLL
jgi:hypothetical protein